MSDNLTILAIETASNACSVGLLHQQNYFKNTRVGNNIHSQVLLSMVDDVLTQQRLKTADLDAVAVDHGPGSFTGLRIGIGVAQGIAFAARRSMVGVSSLDILAHAIASVTPGVINILSGLDARMSEIYWCCYQSNNGQLSMLTDYQVSQPNAIHIEHEEPWFAVGNAWQTYHQQLPQALLDHVQIDAVHELPTATSLLSLAQQKMQQGLTVAAVDFVPDYVRDDVAKKSFAKK